MQVAIIMEYLEGGELLTYLQEKVRLDEDEARGIFLQLVDAISYCHKEKIIHRDLKLENILMSNLKSKTIKVICPLIIIFFFFERKKIKFNF